ncbi:MAG: 50S ribosomal protein L10 [Patescibacteria group bacterium]
MPKTKEQKQQIVDELSDKLGNLKSAVFTSISGYTMTDANDLRQKGKEQGIELAITKKTLLLRALEKQGISVSKDSLEGSVLTSFGYKDEVAPAKMIAGFIKGREQMQILGGILEGAFVDAQSIKILAQLPSKQELLAKVVGSINAPVAGFVNVLAGNLRGLVTVLNSIKESKA